MDRTTHRRPASNRMFLYATTVTVLVVGGAYWHAHLARGARIDPVIAMVNGSVIHQSDLKPLSPPVPSDQALGLMVDFTLLDQAARKKGITVSDSELARDRAAVQVNQRAQTYAAAAAALGKSPAGLDLLLKHADLLEKLSTTTRPHDPTAMYHVRGILVRAHGGKSTRAALKRAGALTARVEAGSDIQALAKVDSDDPLSAADGGDLGIIQTFGAPNTVKQSVDFKLQIALAKAVGSAKPGSVLGSPILGDRGYWVVQVASTAKDPRADTDLYEHVITEWRSSWLAKLEPGVMARLRSAAFIEPPLADNSQAKKRS